MVETERTKGESTPGREGEEGWVERDTRFIRLQSLNARGFSDSIVIGDYVKRYDWHPKIRPKNDEMLVYL